MNMFKKNGGFTLVELIVVIAILAILAAVAVPAYSGYISKANKAADITELGAVKTAAMATYATEGTVTAITVTETTDNAAATIKVWLNGATGDENAKNPAADADFKTYMNIAANAAFAIELDSGSSASWPNAQGEWEIAE